jgi:hypothetical protein
MFNLSEWVNRVVVLSFSYEFGSGHVRKVVGSIRATDIFAFLLFYSLLASLAGFRASIRP